MKNPIPLENKWLVVAFGESTVPIAWVCDSTEAVRSALIEAQFDGDGDILEKHAEMIAAQMNGFHDENEWLAGTYRISFEIGGVDIHRLREPG